LKQTEAHLMKLLDMRKREMQRRGPKNLSLREKKQDSKTLEDSQLAPVSEEISSMKFLLGKMVSDRVKDTLTKETFRYKMSDYSDLMQSLVIEIKKRDELKKKRHPTESTCEEVDEIEQNIQEIELKIELIGSELEDIGKKIPCTDNFSDQRSMKMENDNEEKEENVIKMVSKLTGPCARTLLLEILGEMTHSELNLKKMEEASKRKDLTIQSFKSEVDTLNKKLGAFSHDFIKHKSQLSKFNNKSNNDLSDNCLDLNNMVNTMKNDLKKEKEGYLGCRKDLDEYKKKFHEIQHELAVCREKLYLIETSNKCKNSDLKENVLSELQTIWLQLGFPLEKRELILSQIDSCLEETCNSLLRDAKTLQQKTEVKINELRIIIISMFKSLGNEDKIFKIEDMKNQGFLMFQHLELLQDSYRKLQPTFRAATERRERIAREVQGIIKAVEPLELCLSNNLQLLLNRKGKNLKRRRLHRNETLPKLEMMREKRAKQFKEVESMMKALEDAKEDEFDFNEPDITAQYPGIEKEDPAMLKDENGLLSDEVLNECERDLKELRQFKAKLLVQNNELALKTRTLIDQMNLSNQEIVSLVSKLAKNKNEETLHWWDSLTAEEVSNTLSISQSIMKVNGAFTKHLLFFNDSLETIAQPRRILSEKLRIEIEKIHRTLLRIVDSEGDTNEANESFQAAFLTLPPLSLDYVNACIGEMNKQIAPVENMTNSEIETLTILWEEMNVNSSERARFWTEVDEMITKLEAEKNKLFDDVLHESSSKDAEDWMICTIKDASKAYHILDLRIQKLCKVHEMVKKLITKKDVKSNIISLDSELRVISAGLAEFEEKAGNKHRLLTKKLSSSSFLKEERFRKQSQIKFASKLELLCNLLQEWEKCEGQEFDVKILSEDVRNLVMDSDKMQTLVKERTKFMHLRTVNSSKKSRSPEVNDFTISDPKKKCLKNNQTRESSADLTLPLETYSIHGDNRQCNVSKTETKLSISLSSHKSNNESKTAKHPKINNLKKHYCKGNGGNGVSKSSVMSKRCSQPKKSTKSSENKVFSKRRQTLFSPVPLSRKDANSSENNALVTNSSSKKRLTVNIEKERILEPFGNLLNTPKNKENFQP